MTHATCRLTAKNRGQLRNHTLGNRVWATFSYTDSYQRLLLVAAVTEMASTTRSVIPVVDFSSLSLHVDTLNDADVQSTADQIINAFTSVGFVYLSNTGFPTQLA